VGPVSVCYSFVENNGVKDCQRTDLVGGVVSLFVSVVKGAENDAERMIKPFLP